MLRSPDTDESTDLLETDLFPRLIDESFRVAILRTREQVVQMEDDDDDYRSSVLSDRMTLTELFKSFFPICSERPSETWYADLTPADVSMMMRHHVKRETND